MSNVFLRHEFNEKSIFHWHYFNLFKIFQDAWNRIHQLDPIRDSFHHIPLNRGLLLVYRSVRVIAIIMLDAWGTITTPLMVASCRHLPFTPQIQVVHLANFTQGTALQVKYVGLYSSCTNAMPAEFKIHRWNA